MTIATKRMWRLSGMMFSTLMAGSSYGGDGQGMKKQETPPRLIVFVCEHGSAKSLAAASFFERLAKERGMAIRAVSRGTALMHRCRRQLSTPFATMDSMSQPSSPSGCRTRTCWPPSEWSPSALTSARLAQAPARPSCAGMTYHPLPPATPRHARPSGRT